MRILLAKRRALGDTILMSGTFEMLKAARPTAELYALVPGAFAPVLEGHPAVKKVFTYDAGFFSLVKSLRAIGLDHFIQLHSSPSNKWLPRFSGAKNISFSVQNNETEKAYGKHPNALEWDPFFLRTLFGEKISVPAPAPKVFLSPEEIAAGRAYWQAQGAEPEKVVFLGLGASRPTKRWPPAHFARLAELLRDRYSLVPAFVTGPGEAEERFSAQVLDQLRVKGLRPLGAGGKGDFVHGAGLPVRKLAAALSAVRCYVGNDSGPKHLAVAVGVPTFTFFGPEDPVEWHPYPRAAHPVFFRPGLDCRREDGGRWCGLEECDLQGQLRHRCMQDIDPLDVVETLKAELRL